MSIIFYVAVCYMVLFCSFLVVSIVRDEIEKARRKRKAFQLFRGLLK